MTIQPSSLEQDAVDESHKKLFPPPPKWYTAKAMKYHFEVCFKRFRLPVHSFLVPDD